MRLEFSIEDKVRHMAEYMEVEAIAQALKLTPEAVEDILAGRAEVRRSFGQRGELAPVVHVTSARLAYRQKVVAVLHAKGGAGATSVAIGLAYALSRDVKTLLCDFSFQQGASDLAYYLGLDRRRDLPDLGRFDGANLEECAVQADRNLFVLLAPPQARGEEEKAAAAVQAARRDFDAVVQDFPAALTEPLSRAARECNAAVAVTSGLVPELFRLAFLLRRLDFSQVVLVANACSLSRAAADLFEGASPVRVEEDRELARAFERGELPREKGAFMRAMFAVKDALYEPGRRSAARAK